ncbi:MAG: tRNA lysidine(34) synthetase TilS [Gallionella sp.]|nr:tRNA lysidine(34) synthetase TilS [Gallionella sp.]
MASSRKSNLADLVAVRLAPLLPEHSSILVGLSGGLDSVVLLHLLHQLAPRFHWHIAALHVHHGISPNANAWARFCTDLCRSLSIPLTVERVDIQPLREQGIEAAARTLRHAAFARQPCDGIVLAHHADDQAETLLLQLLRGAGLRGVSAMPVAAASGAAQPAVLRPLLDISRTQLCDYARVHELAWVEDESNRDERYPRNFLRHRIFPVLEESFPAYRTNLTRAAQHFAEASALLDELAREDAGTDSTGAVLSLARLRELTLPRAKNLLRWFLHERGAPMPSEVQLAQMLQQCLTAAADANPCIRYGDWELRRYRNHIHAFPAFAQYDSDLCLNWQGEAGLHWSPLGVDVVFTRTRGQGMSLAKLQSAPLTLRLRHGNIGLRPNTGAATRSLKNLLQENAVPPWRRERLPLLFCGDELVCVVGVAIAAEFQCAADEEGVLLNLVE